jgi:LacI family gluconate utilization system Gnt-I transcriptional repressor
MILRLFDITLGYVPDLRAGSLASAGSKSRSVGAIVPTLSNAWFADTLDGLSAVLAAQGFQLLLGQTRYDPAQTSALLEAFRAGAWTRWC